MAAKSPENQMHFAMVMDGAGGHLGGWRLPGAEYGPENLSLLIQCAEMAERAKFDMLFVADSPAAALGAGDMVRIEPMAMMAALAAVTRHIGLGMTVSTTYYEPYNVARMLASIDHISHGRAAWNVVTTSAASAAANYGEAKHAPKLERYERAAEFLEVTKGLWDSWEDGFGPGVRVPDLSHRHDLNHKGRFFSVKGPLNMSRPPQGYPVIVQAGASETGMPFAARTGEVIFCVQESPEVTKTFTERVKQMAAEAGRDPGNIRVIPGLCPFVAETEEKAKQEFWRLAEFIDADAAWGKLTSRLGIDLTGLDPEGPVPEIPWNEMRGHAKTLTAVARKHNFNLHQLRDYAAAASGHRLGFGTPEMVADDLEHWFRMGACDGFMIIPPWVPGSISAFTETVIPILQKRGLFRTEYSGRTLREHLGLPRPPHPLAGKQAAA